MTKAFKPKSINMRQLHIHALGINTGGGFILLKQLLENAGGSLGFVYIDDRIRAKVTKKNNYKYYKHSFINEYKSQVELRKSVHSQDHVLFFSNRPPLIKFPCKVSVFHQNALLLEDVKFIDIKAKINQLWFKIFKNNANQFVVQNQTMRRLLSKHGCHQTAVVNAPFFDTNELSKGKNDRGYIYVASCVKHKNHKNLIKAWEYLAYNGVKEPLTLITSGPCDEIKGIIDQSPSKSSIQLLNGLTREQVLEQYKKHKSLIFPSQVESLGLPLLEAKACGLSIVASEKDYVRDIIDPDQSFDPSSYISIARAIMRDINHNYNKGQILTSEEFINKLLEKTKVSAPKAS